MELKVVGAGLPRTGTASLQAALQHLTDGRCYHMLEVLQRPEDVSFWLAALDGGSADWDTVFGGYSSAVDWPASAFWRELSDANPDALVLLSLRDTPDAWWKSVERTVFEAFRREQAQPEPSPFATMLAGTVSRAGFGADWGEADAAIAVYERHNDEVRSTIAPGRLLEWQPGDGWEPLCAALDVPVPDEPFPHHNSTADFRAMAGFD